MPSIFSKYSLLKAVDYICNAVGGEGIGLPSILDCFVGSFCG